MKKIALIITCEHAVDTIPNPYKSLFKPYQNLLETHQGVDFGALEVAIYLKNVFSCDLIQSYTTRLLIDYNRSLHNHCFSEVTKNLTEHQKEEIIAQYYVPYREKVTNNIEKHLALGAQVIQCSVHSFTPVLNNKIRNAEIGILYDPSRPLEKKMAKQWELELKKHPEHYRIRRNYPYKGIDDGLTTAMRKKYPPKDYLGLEIELNQALTRDKQALNLLKKAVAESLFCAKSW